MPAQLHMDGDWAWHSEEESAAAGQPWPHPITSLVANFSTSEVTEENATLIVRPTSLHRI